MRNLLKTLSFVVTFVAIFGGALLYLGSLLHPAPSPEPNSLFDLFMITGAVGVIVACFVLLIAAALLGGIAIVAYTLAKLVSSLFSGSSTEIKKASRTAAYALIAAAVAVSSAYQLMAKKPPVASDESLAADFVLNDPDVSRRVGHVSLVDVTSKQHRGDRTTRYFIRYQGDNHGYVVVDVDRLFRGTKVTLACATEIYDTQDPCNKGE
jgi:hypothetical protein